MLPIYSALSITMAEILAGIGAFTAVTTLAGQFMKTSKRLNYYARHTTYAREEIEAADHDVSQFNITLKMFKDSIDDPSAENVAFVQAAASTNLPIILSQQSKIVLRGVDRVLESIKPLRNDVTASLFTKLRARLSWALRKDELEPLKSSLKSIQLSMILFCQFLIVKSVQHQVRVLKQQGLEVSRLQEKL